MEKGMETEAEERKEVKKEVRKGRKLRVKEAESKPTKPHVSCHSHTP